jgi:IrrE N-terminal-like domain
MSAQLQIKSFVPYLSEGTLEDHANTLPARYEREVAPIIGLPVPIEGIVDLCLQLAIEWLPIADSERVPILAYLDPARQVVRVNEARRQLFDRYQGLYEYTLAHEAGHFELHVENTGPRHRGRVDMRSGSARLCRYHAPKQDRREVQAQIFAAYLLMPKHLVLPSVAGLDLTRRQTLRDLQATWRISKTALRIRLQALDLMHQGLMAPKEALVQFSLWSPR